MSTAETLSFPPLLDGHAAAGSPLEEAVSAAARGAEAGLLLYDAVAADVDVALVLVPEVSRRSAAQMIPLAGVAFQNALGALGPSEVAVHLAWDGRIMVNGAECGRVRAVAPSSEGDAAPDWLVLSLTVRATSPEGVDGGKTPDITALDAEGCGDVAPLDLVEAWARHALNWIHRWEEDGAAELHREWTNLAHGIGDPVNIGGVEGTALGLDEDMNLLVKTPEGTRAVPLVAQLEAPTS
ncbi:Biotin-(acetyl-CoA carboxylase) ligase [Roseivivax marinus]|uniref:biotin/lipoate--protein ligase family protein n=1 Tax=Roseivivax marinus TaxID=1379903 RepID=UPI0008BD46DC|nr:biotin/lipoate--protein ligase family protein [Roseivivax marinus]SEL77552.1 Biotin-(acetyl-CoA carboxylase) ligase [Roseivivax marinus]